MPTKIVLGISNPKNWTPDRRELICKKMRSYIWGIKAGSENRDRIAPAINFFTAPRLFNEMLAYDCATKNIPFMLDYKPDETSGAIEKIAENWPLKHVSLLTVSCNESEKCLRTIAGFAHAAGAKVLGVTVKTDMPSEDCWRIYNRAPGDATVALANHARQSGLDGVVVPGPFLPRLDDIFPPEFIRLVAGLRDEGEPAGRHVWPITPQKAALFQPHFVVADSTVWNSPDPLAELENLHELFERA